MQTDMRYIRLTRGLSDKGILIKPEETFSYVKDTTKDYYTSVFYYNDNHLKQFKEKGTVKGIEDVVTDKIVLDFDSKSDLEQAQKDTVEACNRLQRFGILHNAVEVYFSGKKGFTVIVTLNREITPAQLANIAINKIGRDLKTLDTSIYNASRILRVPGTKHPDGLYKIPLTIKQLTKLTVEDIKKKAQSLDNLDEEYNWDIASPNEELFKMPEEKKSKSVVSNTEMDFSKKPSQWRNCKWSLLQGNFKEGERHQALMVIAATARGLGYDKETTYYLCKSALKKQSSLTGQDEFPKEELYNNIIEESVFTDSWDGGQYTCTKPGWLQNYCKTLGEHSCENKGEDEPSIVSVDKMSDCFSEFASDFERNVIKTGIEGLDSNVMLCSSTLNGLLGQPGSGKTNMSLNYLRNTSLAGIPSTFFSLDMGMPIVMAKLVQKQTGLSFKRALELYKNDRVKAAEVSKMVKDDFKNVGFNFKSGLTIPDIKATVREQEQQIGNKVKLVVIDYLECLAGPYSDATANSGFLANQLKDLANDLSACILLLLQTQKHSTPDISDPLLSLRSIKGSSLVEQSMSTILTMWRDGYNPKTVDDDKYVSFAVVKNRFGSLWSGDFSWDGVTGNIRGLSEEEHFKLEDFRERKQEEKLKSLKDSKEGWQ